MRPPPPSHITSKAPAPTCPYCGGHDIVQELTPEVSGKVRTDISFAYWPGTKLLGVPNTEKEPVFADLCSACGTIVRLYVKNPTRQWTTDKSTPEPNRDLFGG